MTNIFAKEFAKYNITCNSLAISAFQTDMLDQQPREKIESVVAGLPLPRFACEDDILNVIDFFVSHRSSYITAQTIHLGGVN
jgi:3-oxoacyl-[acyl-carrier protein] reductase